MKELLIIGARGFGREIFNLAKNCKGYCTEYEIKGFLDDKSDALDNFEGYPPIISSVEDYTPENDDVFTCALGNPSYKRKYVEIIKNKGGVFLNIISPLAHIGSNATIGEGLIMQDFSLIGQDVNIGDFVTFGGSGSVGHDCIIDDYSHIGAAATVGGGCHVGEEVLIYPGAHIVPKRKIMRGATIGIGSIVLKNIKENTTVFGNPAKEI